MERCNASYLFIYLLGITSSEAPRVGAISSMPMPLGMVGDLDVFELSEANSIQRSERVTHGGGSSLYLGAISSMGNAMKEVYLSTHITLSRNHFLKTLSLEMASSFWSRVNV